ncbi:MAG: hypothetical protein LBL33_09790 [Tannerella sp.]|nr:hypothetical protein [Tannerella sp.]
MLFKPFPHTSWAQASKHRELISTKSYRMKYNTGSGYDPSLLRNAQPVRGYAGQLRSMRCKIMDFI